MLTERVPAAPSLPRQAAASREAALREGDGSVERAHACVDRGDVAGARRLAAAAREAYARAGGALDQRAVALAKLEEGIEKVDQYSALRAEGDGHLKVRGFRRVGRRRRGGGRSGRGGLCASRRGKEAAS